MSDAFKNPLGWAQTGVDPDANTNEDAFKGQMLETFELNMNIARTFNTPHGKKVLAFLRKATIESATWMSSLPYQEAIAHGFAREGQNALVRDIENRIEIAQKCKTPEDLGALMTGVKSPH